jgi:hypothetical protein
MSRYGTVLYTISESGDTANNELQILSSTRTTFLLTKARGVVSVKALDPKLMSVRYVVPPGISLVRAHKTKNRTALVPGRENCRGRSWYLF